MRKTLLLSALPFLCIGAYARGATWYVDASVVSSGDGQTWQTAFNTIQEGIDAASDGDSVIVAPGTYSGNVRFNGKNVALTSTDPVDPHVVAGTTIRYGDPVVAFYGTEDATCTLSGFTISGGALGIWGWSSAARTRATIENNVVTGNSGDLAGGIAGCDGIIRNNVIIGNHASNAGGAIAHCNGLIENNTIMGNCVGPGICAQALGPTNDDYEIYVRPGGGLYDCNGVIRGNLIVGNTAWGHYYGLGEYQGWGGGLAECSGIIENNVIWGNGAYQGHFGGGEGGGLWACTGLIRNNVIAANRAEKGGGGADSGVLRNCIVWANSAVLEGPQLHQSSDPAYSCIEAWGGGGEGNISEDPRFVDEEKGDFRLRADSPCIDAGLNSPALPEFDIAGMHRIMFGGKSLTVDMGAYEFYINKLEPVPGTNEGVFTWSSLADKTYSIFYTDDLFNWHTAIANFPSSGNTTTFWVDDGSQTGLPPGLVPRRFYRTLENPQ